jgi:mono/diheme cytochrome c family protein
MAVKGRAPARCALLFGLAGSVAVSGCAPERDLGTRVWKRRCAVCHGVDGSGRTRFAAGRPYANLVDGVWKHSPETRSMRELLLHGEPKSPMPAFEGKLTPGEIDAVIVYVQKLAARKVTP